MFSLSGIMSALIIIMGSAYIGITYASKYEIAVKQTEAFANSMKMLEFDISFLRLPLHEAFERISKNQSGTVKKIYSFLSNELKEGRSTSVGALFRTAVEKYSSELEVSENTKNVLLDFCNCIGHMNAENEIANIKACYVKLKYYEDEARQIAGKTVKMYRGLGLLGGIFIVLILC